MNSIDLTPLYRNSVGFDRFASLIDNALTADTASSVGYPPYNIEMLEENQYAITVAVAGFEEQDLDIKVEQGVLSVSGNKPEQDDRKYMYRGIAKRNFTRKFNLADHIEVTGAELNNGLLTIHLLKEIPEAMKPKTISISQNHSNKVLENKGGDKTEDELSEAVA